MEAFTDVIRAALVTAALLSLPILAVVTLIGTLVAIVQAATQIQEQTLPLLPKVLAVGTMIALFGGFALELCRMLLTNALRRVPEMLHG